MDPNLFSIVAILLVVVLSAVGVFKMFDAMVKLIAFVLVMILAIFFYNNVYYQKAPIPDAAEQQNDTVEQPDTIQSKHPAELPYYDDYSPGTIVSGHDSILIDPETGTSLSMEMIRRHWEYYNSHKEINSDSAKAFNLLYTQENTSPNTKSIDPKNDRPLIPSFINCHRYKRSEYKYIVVEDIYDSKARAEEQVAFLKNNNFEDAQIICLSCFAGYEEDRHFAVILDRPCKLEATAFEIHEECNYKWRNNDWQAIEMKIYQLGDLKDIDQSASSSRPTAQKVGRRNQQKIY